MARKPGPAKIIGWVLKTFLYIVILLIVFLMVWRIWFSTKIPEEILRIDANDALKQAYLRTGGELGAYNQLQDTITRGEANKGYFSIEECIIIPEAKQVQIIFRYNRSTLKALAKDYKLEAVPERDSEVFEVSLLKTTDLTPDNKKDNADKSAQKEIRYFPSCVIRSQTRLYNYERIVFENVDIDNETIGVFADIYYKGDIDYEKDAYGSLCIYDYITERRGYTFSKKDIELMK